MSDVPHFQIVRALLAIGATAAVVGAAAVSIMVLTGALR